MCVERERERVRKGGKTRVLSNRKEELFFFYQFYKMV